MLTKSSRCFTILNTILRSGTSIVQTLGFFPHLALVEQPVPPRDLHEELLPEDVDVVGEAEAEQLVAPLGQPGQPAAVGRVAAVASSPLPLEALVGGGGLHVDGPAVQQGLLYNYL